MRTNQVGFRFGKVLLAIIVLPAVAGCVTQSDEKARGPVVPVEPSTPPLPALDFLPTVALLCPDVDPPPYSCGRFGEPVVEVQGDGTIWASATCCVGRSPPIWISRDDGKTFELLTPTTRPGTEIVRQAVGIEGDFAVDDAGNVYFFDILAATSWFTSYDPQGNHRWTLTWPFEPLVDRPWVRAGQADEVWVIYNTGSATKVYQSTDGGRTWSPLPQLTVPCFLGTGGQGPERDRLFVAGCITDPMLYLSTDGGQTWGDPEDVPMPKGDYSEGRGVDFMPPVSDAAGNIYVPFSHFIDEEQTRSAVFVSRRVSDGTWAGPFQVSETGAVAVPWPAAGDRGRLGIAWYQANVDWENETKAQWVLMTGASMDADAAKPTFRVSQADPEVLFKGVLGRGLGDFLQADITPDGRLVVVYGKNVDGSVENRFVSSDGAFGFGAGVPRNGPRAG